MLALVTFTKAWFNLRLLKGCDSVASFFFLSYADSMVQQVFDQVMTQKRLATEASSRNFKQLPEDDPEEKLDEVELDAESGRQSKPAAAVDAPNVPSITPR